MELSYLDKKYGLRKNYFSGLKYNNKKKFNLIFKTGNKDNDITNYVNYVKGLISDMETILYKFEDDKILYARMLLKHKLSKAKKNLYSVYPAHEQVVFKFRNFEDYFKITTDQIESWEKIIKVLKHYEVEDEK